MVSQDSISPQSVHKVGSFPLYRSRKRLRERLRDLAKVTTSTDRHLPVRLQSLFFPCPALWLVPASDLFLKGLTAKAQAFNLQGCHMPGEKHLAPEKATGNQILCSLSQSPWRRPREYHHAVTRHVPRPLQEPVPESHLHISQELRQVEMPLLHEAGELQNEAHRVVCLLQARQTLHRPHRVEALGGERKEGWGESGI